MPKSDAWPGGTAMESSIKMDSASSCDSVVSMNSGFNDDSLEHLSAEERACLLFLEETIESLEMEEDSGLAYDEPKHGSLVKSFPPSISPMVQTSLKDSSHFQHGENCNVPKALLLAKDCPHPQSKAPGGDSEPKTDVALQAKTVVIPTDPKAEALVKSAGQASSTLPAGTVLAPASLQDPPPQLHNSMLAESDGKSSPDLPGQLNPYGNPSPVSGLDLKTSHPATLDAMIDSSLRRREIDSNLKTIPADGKLGKSHVNVPVNLDLGLIPPPSDFRDELESQLEQGPTGPYPENSIEPPLATGPSARGPLTYTELEQLRERASVKRAPPASPTTPDPPYKFTVDLPGSTSTLPPTESLACPVSEAAEPRSPPAVAPKPKRLPSNIILKSHKAPMVNPDGHHASSNLTTSDKVMMDPQKVRREALQKLGLLKCENVESAPLRGQALSPKAKSSSPAPSPASTTAPALMQSSNRSPTPTQRTAPTSTSRPILDPTPAPSTAPPPTLHPNPTPNTSPRPALAPAQNMTPIADLDTAQRNPGPAPALTQVGPASDANPAPSTRSTLIPAPTFSTAQFQFPTTSPAPIPVQTPTPTPAPIPVQAPTTTPAPIPVQAPTTTLAPIPVQAPTTTPAPIPVQAPTTVPAPIPVQAPTTTPAPIPVQAPTTVPAPIPVQAPTTVPAPIPVQTPSPTPAPIPVQAPTKDTTSVPTPAPVPASARSLVPVLIPAPAAFNDHDKHPEQTVFDSPKTSIGERSVTLERSGIGLSSYIASQASGKVHHDTTADLSPAHLRNVRPRPASLGSGKDFVQAGVLQSENRKSLHMASVLEPSEPSEEKKLPRSSGISVLICPRGENGFDRREALKKLGLLRN